MDRAREGLAGLSFLLLFPGYMAYHYGISAGWWPAFLGGLFAAATVLVALFSLWSATRPLPAGERPEALQLMLIAFMGYMVLWTLGHLPFIGHQGLTSAVVTESFATVTIWIAATFVGARFPHAPRDITRIGSIGILLVLVSFGHAFYAVGFPTGPFLAFVNAEDGAYSTYQGIGRSLLAVGLVTAFAAKPFELRAMLVLVSATLLMLALGSRAHFVVLCLVIAVQTVLLTARPGSRILGIFSLVLSVAIAAASVPFFLETRAAEIIDLASSNSWDERTIANHRALEVIGDSPVGGAFGYHAWDVAGYAHNVLSAWTQYGLAGFILFSLLMLLALARSVAGYRDSAGQDAAWILALHINLVSIVLALASEPIMSSVFPALGWGFTLRAIRLTRAARVASVAR